MMLCPTCQQYEPPLEREGYVTCLNSRKMLVGRLVKVETAEVVPLGLS